MIAVAKSRELECFVRERGRHSELQAVKGKASTDAKAQYATCGLSPNGSCQVVDRVRRVDLLALPELPLHISEDGRRRRIALMPGNAFQQVAGGRKVILCRQQRGLEDPHGARIAREVRSTVLAQQTLELRHRLGCVIESHADER